MKTTPLFFASCILLVTSASSSVPAQMSGKQVQPNVSEPAMPFGRVADLSAPSQGPIPNTPTTLRLDESVQEQEHPDQRSGTPDAPLPDALADVRSRPPQPLSFFEDSAAKTNPTLRQAEAQVRRLQAEAKQQGLWDNPEIGYEADHVRGGSYHSGEQGGYVQQVVPLAGQRSAARAAIQASAAQAQAVVEQQRVRIRSAVRQAFYAALAVQQEVALRQQLVDVASEAAIAAHQYANIGQADAPDVLQSELEREQARLDLLTAQRAYRKAFALLAAVSGDAMQPVSMLTGDLAALPMLDAGASDAAARNSPTLQTAHESVSVSDATLRSARRQQMPQLTVHAGLQQDNEPLESTRGRVGVVGVAQAGITLPLWNRNQGAVEAAKASRLAAVADVARTQLMLHMQAEQTWQDYQVAIAQAARYRTELLPRAERTNTLYRQKYASMAATYPQVLSSERTLLQLRIDYTHALAAGWQSATLLQNGLLSDGLAAPDAITAQSARDVTR